MSRRGSQAGGVAAVALVSALVLGCGGSATLTERGPMTRAVVIEVQNNNWQDARIYVKGLGPRIRLGTVTSLGSERFTVPASYIDSEGLRLLVRLFASAETKVTNTFAVLPGDRVELTVQNQLSLTSYAVRAPGH